MGENTFGGHTILDCCTAKRAPVQPKPPHSRPPTATLRSRLSRQQHAPSIALRTTDDPGSIPLSLTTIKRAEVGRAVRFRIAREFARCFEVVVTKIVRADDSAAGCNH